MCNIKWAFHINKKPGKIGLKINYAKFKSTGAGGAAVPACSACQRLLLPSGLVKNHLAANGKANGCLPRTGRPGRSASDGLPACLQAVNKAPQTLITPIGCVNRQWPKEGRPGMDLYYVVAPPPWLPLLGGSGCPRVCINCSENGTKITGHVVVGVVGIVPMLLSMKNDVQQK